MKLVLTAQTKADLISAAEFYNDHEPSLGGRFLSAVEAKIAQILTFPESAEVGEPDPQQGKELIGYRRKSKSEFRMCPEANQPQCVGVGFLIDQHQVGLHMTIAMIFPVAA